MKVFAIVWIVAGAALVSIAAVLLLTRGFGPGTTTLIATSACVGAPFLAFGVWGLYAELKPYHYERKKPQQ